MGKRYDLRDTEAYLRSNPPAALFMAAVCALAGVASVLGLLRLRPAFLQWAFSLSAWGFAAFCVQCAVRGLRGR